MEDPPDHSEGLEEGANKSLNDSTANKFECAVCLQICVQPVQLPCSHIFCYLCVKGVTHQSKRCAMCRQEIPPNFLDDPHLIQVNQSSTAFEDGYQWFYEGRNGWWQYDERTSAEIESAFEKGVQECEVLIAGFLYVIDFQNLVQMRRSDLFRRRRIKRDLSSIPKKGVAGIRAQSIPTDNNTQSKESSSSSEDMLLSNECVAQSGDSLFSSSDEAASTSEPLDLSKSADTSNLQSNGLDSNSAGGVQICYISGVEGGGRGSQELSKSEKSPAPCRSRNQIKKK